MPDNVVFCDSISGSGPQITYGELRGNQDEAFRLECLKVRIESWLIKQCDDLNTRRSCPFPLAVTTLVGIGSLAEIFYRDSVAAESADANRMLFSKFCVTLDQRIGRTLTKRFKESFIERWSVEKPETLADLLYTFFRNSLLHGYYGRAVFITADETDDVECDEDGFVRLNPFWLYEQFKTSAMKHSADALQEESNGTLRRNALNYVERLLASE